MKHLYSVLLTCALVLCMGCGEKQTVTTTEAKDEITTEATIEMTTEEATTEEMTTEEMTTEEMTTEEAMADPFEIGLVGDLMPLDFFKSAKEGMTSILEGTVASKDEWSDNQATFYLQCGDLTVTLKNMACNAAEYDMINAGTTIRVSGTKVDETTIENVCFDIK